MEKYDKFFLDRGPCSKISMLVFEQGHWLVKEKLVKDNICQCKLLVKCTCQGNLSYFSFTLPRKTCQGKTCQGELASVYSRQVFLDKWTCQGKLASVNEALCNTGVNTNNTFVLLLEWIHYNYLSCFKCFPNFENDNHVLCNSENQQLIKDNLYLLVSQPFPE